MKSELLKIRRFNMKTKSEKVWRLEVWTDGELKFSHLAAKNQTPRTVVESCGLQINGALIDSNMAQEIEIKLERVTP